MVIQLVPARYGPNFATGGLPLPGELVGTVSGTGVSACLCPSRGQGSVHCRLGQAGRLREEPAESDRGRCEALRVCPLGVRKHEGERVPERPQGPWLKLLVAGFAPFLDDGRQLAAA